MFNQWTERAEYNGRRDELAQLIASEQQQLDAMRRDFRDWWTAALAQRFASVLRTATSPTTDSPSFQKPTAEEARQVVAIVSASKESIAHV